MKFLQLRPDGAIAEISIASDQIDLIESSKENQIDKIEFDYLVAYFLSEESINLNNQKLMKKDN